MSDNRSRGDVNPYAPPRVRTAKRRAQDDYDYDDDGDFEYAGFLTRFAAAFLDGIILNVIMFILGFAIGFVMVASGVDPASSGAQVGLQLFGIVFNLIWVGLFVSSSYQATPGKMALGLKVTNLDGQRISFLNSIGREFAKILSAVILLIGFLMQPFTARKQALHDILASTLVIKG